MRKANSVIESQSIESQKEKDALRTEMQASSDQIIEQISDEHQQTIADFEHEIAALQSELETARITKPKSIKEVAVDPVFSQASDVTTPFPESTGHKSSQSPPKNTAAKSPLI